MIRPNERTPKEIKRIDTLARVHIRQDMEETQTIKRKKPATLITATRRRNPSEKKIPPPYSAEKESNQNTTGYQKCANPVHRALYS
jgi:hypothetical protein